MKQKTGKTKDEILAFRVEILDSQWQETRHRKNVSSSKR